MQPFKVDFDALDWQSPLPGARYRSFATAGRQLRIVEFTDTFVEPHWCEKGHIGLVLDGTLELEIQGRRIVYPPGSGLFIPRDPANAHKARSLTPVVRLMLVEDV